MCVARHHFRICYYEDMGHSFQATYKMAKGAVYRRTLPTILRTIIM